CVFIGSILSVFARSLSLWERVPRSGGGGQRLTLIRPFRPPSPQGGRTQPAAASAAKKSYLVEPPVPTLPCYANRCFSHHSVEAASRRLQSIPFDDWRPHRGHCHRESIRKRE